MKKFKVLALFLLVGYCCTTLASAGGGGVTGGAREVTQLLNHSELVTQIQKLSTQINNQITMIQDMVFNTKSMVNQVFPDVRGLYADIRSVMNKTNGIMHTLANYDEEVKRRFKSYASIATAISSTADFSKEYNGMIETRMETTRSVMEGLGVMAKDFENDAKVLQKLQEKAADAQGRNEIAQGANQLLAFLGQELMRLRELQMMQLSATSAAMEADRASKDLERQREERAFKGKLEETETYDPSVFNKRLWDF